MHEKVGRYIHPEEGDEQPQPTRKRVKAKNTGNTPQELKRMRQNFYSQFYLLNGLSKFRNIKEYSKSEDIFQTLTDTSSLIEQDGKNPSSSGDT